MLSPNDLQALLRVLKPLETLDAVFNAFVVAFPDKTEFFRIGNAIVLLIQEDGLLPEPTQRIACLYILHEMYRGGELLSNPFCSLLLDIVSQTTVDGANPPSYEVDFVKHLLTAPSNLQHLSSQTIVGGFLATLPLPVNSIKKINFLLENLEKMRQQMRESAPKLLQMPNAKGQTEKDSSRMPSFPLPSVVPPPPLWNDTEDELMWTNPPFVLFPVEWDNAMCTDASPSSEIRSLMAKALRGPLPSTQQQHILQEFENDYSQIYNCGLIPEKFPALVENNPLISTEILIKMIAMSSPQLPDYLHALVTMDISLHSMEVVNRLTGFGLSREYIYAFIDNCIRTCESIERPMQNRMVRLVCVFLQSLIRNKIVDVQDLFIEVQAFCIAFSRIREAAALFRMLKTMEPNS